MVNLYRRGRIAEKKVTGWLKYHGFTNVRRNKGSRGANDIYAVSPAGIKSYFQVKSNSANCGRKDIERLRALAKQRKGFAACVQYPSSNKFKMTPFGNWSGFR